MEREIINKLSVFLNEIRNIKEISIFVIIKREDTNLWDIVIGGPNFNNQENLVKTVNVLKKFLTPNEMKNFSRVVLLDSTDAFVDGLRKTFLVEHGDMELRNAQINNIFIRQAYLLYSK